jgi:GNAT superfamily N-acetyltransferase
MPDIEIRRARIEDLDHGLLETLAAVYPEPLGRDDAYVQFTRRDIVSNIHTLVAVEQGKIVGTAMMYFELAPNRLWFCWLEDVAVLPAKQRHGIGKILVEACEAEARKRQCYKIGLQSTFKAIPFYESLGYKRAYNDGQTYDPEMMRKDLL